MTSLEAELQRWALRERQQQQRARGHGLNVRAYRQFFSDKAAGKETRKVETGIRLNSNGTVTLNGTTYTRDEFRGALEMNIKAQREDPKSAYRNARDPNHKQTVEEINLAYKFLNNELSPQDETEIVSEWHEATTQEGEVSNTLLPHQEIAQIVGTLEGRTALQRERMGQPLDPAQKKIVERHNELETANNVVARREQAVKGGTFKTARPHTLPRAFYDLERISDPREKAHAIREMRAQMRDNKESAFNLANHPEHRNAVEQMQRLYAAESELGPLPEDPE
jgi:hypothetical protein